MDTGLKVIKYKLKTEKKKIKEKIKKDDDRYAVFLVPRY